MIQEKLVSQCNLTQPEADKFFTSEGQLDHIQGVKIENIPTVVKLEPKDSNMVLSNFLTNKQICSITVPKIP